LVKFLETRQLKFAKFFTIVILIIAVASTIEFMKNNRQKKLVIYDAGVPSYFDLFLDGQCYSNLVYPEDTSFLAKYNIVANRKYNCDNDAISIEKLKLRRRIGENSVIKIDETIFLFVKEDWNLENDNAKIKVDHLIIDHNSSNFLAKLNRSIDYNYLIMDGSISSTASEKIEENAQRGAKIHSISKAGAYVLNL